MGENASVRNRYRALFDRLDEGVCFIEKLPLRGDGLRNYRYVAMNRAMLTMFGIPDLSDQTIRDNFPDEAESWYDDYDRVLGTGEPIRFQRRFRTRRSSPSPSMWKPSPARYKSC